MDGLPEFAEIHVISDIHMGGKLGFQILRKTQRLANFIRWVAKQRPTERVALVLNGDVIDTLAEDISGYVAVDEAETTLKRIMDDPAFASIWKALADFVHTDKRTLVLIIGNHDIEIAFPNIQRLIAERLSGGNNAAKAHIEFSAAGAGYGCKVGKARIFCTHGNEVDAWNFNRYEDLSRVARRLNAGLTLNRDEWTPNAGTRMVKEVMNEVKKKYAWIDLLKPETSAAIGTLLALDPTQLSKISKLPPILGAKVVGDYQADKRLSADSLHTPATANNRPPTLESLLGPNVLESMKTTSGASGQSGDDMLRALEKSRTSSLQSQPLMSDAPLGLGQFVWDRLTGWLTGVSRVEALRRALQDWLQGDQTFAIDDKDATYQEVTAKLGANIDFVITGHTHLARAIDMGAGRYYFNSGTWIRLMQFTNDMLANEQKFQPVYDVLVNGHLSAIDAAKINGQPLLLDRTSSVSISLESGKTVGRLNQVIGDGTQAPTVQKQFVRP
ncbi:metallophosphoesterase [Ferriphaselus amnicola]|uniref:Metallophosphoesterase n=1 Tax=Ferriphaselus amnicola TaxID=1188319 RepID=A0A2Z6G9Z0_9PROT|nr:metallophosphoesterase [Ferriphaselus amnicola]BBE50320.1 metallophosphoesterase [Ferriphaselus amnicola]